MHNPCRVAVVSPEEVPCTGLTVMVERLAPDLLLVSATSPDADGSGPDVVLYDAIGLHVGDGADLDHLIDDEDAAVVIYGRSLRPDLATRALNRGADAVLESNVTSEQLLDAVQAACHGDPEHGGAATTADEVRPGHEVGLSERESDVVALITQGLSNQEIAERSFLSINSVKTYIRSAYRKMDVKTRAQAVSWAMQHGFSPEEE